MPIYEAPVADTMFVLFDVLGFERHRNLSGFEEAGRETVEAILNEGAKFARDRLLPLNQVGDREGCRRDEAGNVTTPAGFVSAYQAYGEAGWSGLAADPDHGGMGLPYALATAMTEYITTANMAFGMYPGLTQGAIAALTLHGSEEQKSLYLSKMISGEWSGTMNLTESQAGTDLGLIRTKATPQDDGSYVLSGAKIFISAGEHDLSENIVHLVLARIEGAPEGTKGISLFVVPKLIPNANGALGARNAVSCGSLEHKMGIHGNATCAMNYDNAIGWLVGEENKGLRAMFTMMNEARLAVAVQGLGQSEIAYQNAAAYAKDRLQGRALDDIRDLDRPADPLLVHPDVRRMLLSIRAFNEAARALVLWTALKGDVAHRSDDETERQTADDTMGLMTPVLKGVLTDTGFENTIVAQQVLGGHGYIAEWGMEQFARDARVAMIYEGANGIQALDLVGRKLPANGGRAIMAFLKEVKEDLKNVGDDDVLAPLAAPVKAGLDDLEAATLWSMQHAMAQPNNAAAGSTDYMHLFGLVGLGYMWVRMAHAAREQIRAGAGDRTAWLEAKLDLAHFFMARIMPETKAHLARITSGADVVMKMPAAAF